MEEWQRLLVEGVNSVQKLKERFPEIDERKLQAIARKYPIRINHYYLGLIQELGDPIARQVIPEEEEITDISCFEDALNEEGDSPVPGLTHRYPDRALFYVNYQCAIYCRYCTRKRKVGDPASISRANIQKGLDYIRSHTELRDIVLSGGDPLLLKDEQLDEIVGALRAIPHVEIIRIGTRIPSVLPQRVTQGLCDTLKKHHPIYLMVHFSHPRELTAESKRACDLLADNGFPMMNQTVLLRGINDDPQVLKELFVGLLRLRVKPYYLFQADQVEGAGHFRTNLAKGLDVMKGLRGHTSGLAVPYYVIDAPGGGGKIPILPEYLIKCDEKEAVMRNYEGKIYRYDFPTKEVAWESSSRSPF
ncbi:MAG: KamA family radical SAM protein [Planctomycetes bacterium]|nr:KamA family radical SAM protein [Planctomycetota bacterium]